MSILRKLKEYLDENKVKYVKISHSPAYTAQEIAASIHVPGKELAKTVIVKAQDGYAMAVLPATHKINFNLLKEVMGKEEIRLADEREFKDLFLDCEVGAMPPFGNLYKLPVYVAEVLPPYEEQVITLDMEEHQAEEYRQLESLLSNIVKASLRLGSHKNLASYLQGLLLVPDAVFRTNEITVEVGKKKEVLGSLPVEGVMPKEAELLDIVKKEKQEGRRVLVYCTFTDTRDITPRLKELLEEIGI